MERTLKQYQYTSWPEAGGGAADGANMVALQEEVLAYQKSLVMMPQGDIYGNADAINEQAIMAQIKPVVVHCGQGVGRTGAFIAMSIGMERMAAEKTVDVMASVRHMRSQRMVSAATFCFCADVGIFGSTDARREE
jgi:protein tyrosine phosphatase